MKRAAPFAVAACLVACAGEPPAPLAVMPPPAAEPAPSPPPASPAAAESIVTAPPAAPAPAEAPAAPPPAEPAQPARPSQTEHGQWCVVVASERSEAETKHWVQRLESAGFRVEVEPADVGGTTWYRVLLPGYRAEGDARATLPLANQAAGVKDSFITRHAKKAAAPAAEPAAQPAAEPAPAN